LRNGAAHFVRQQRLVGAHHRVRPPQVLAPTLVRSNERLYGLPDAPHASEVLHRDDAMNVHADSAAEVVRLREHLLQGLDERGLGRLRKFGHYLAF
jgi:hypothetical protein